MRKRDKLIIDDLNRFHVMDRDSIAELHFSKLKNPILATNNVLLRLVRDGHIQRSKAFTPYVYFGPDVSMKKNSAKVGHFLAILNVYKEIKKYEGLETFQVEPKYGRKGTAEPDVFCIFKRAPFFIEVQRTVYSEKQMKEKLNRYVDLYYSKIINQEPWQRVDKKVFPIVLILSEQRYPIDSSYPFKVVQAPSFSMFVQAFTTPKQEKREASPGIKVNAGNVRIRTP